MTLAWNAYNQIDGDSAQAVELCTVAPVVSRRWQSGWVRVPGTRSFMAGGCERVGSQALARARKCTSQLVATLMVVRGRAADSRSSSANPDHFGAVREWHRRCPVPAAS